MRKWDNSNLNVLYTCMKLSKKKFNTNYNKKRSKWNLSNMYMKFLSNRLKYKLDKLKKKKNKRKLFKNHKLLKLAQEEIKKIWQYPYLLKK